MLQRARRGGIRPISIGRALLATLDTQFDELGQGSAISPKYLIAIHPDDAATLKQFEAALLDELRQAVVHHATLEGYSLSSNVEVGFGSDTTVKHGACNVTSIESAVRTPTANKAVVVLGSGERISLTGDLATVGRQSDCQIVIDDHNVSRIHADIRRTTDGWVVTDRESTNGTKVNGEKIITGRLLVSGDIVAFGSTPVRFENS